MLDILRTSTLQKTASALLLTTALAASSANAQSGTSTTEARRSAGEAFDRGTSSMLASDFRAAAHFFEQAYRLAPASVALKQAIRAHDRAGNSFRAATLALRLRDQYPNDADGQQVAADVLDRFGSQYVTVTASCESCAIMVNDALVGEGINGEVHFFIQPSTNATITATFSTGSVTANASGAAGESVTVPAFVAPPPPPEPEPSLVSTTGAGAASADSGGVPRGVFYTLLGVTAAVGGTTIWSGIDTNNGVDAYEANPTQAAYDAGHRKELRTNILAGSTAALGATAILVAIFTDWDGNDEEAPSARRIQDMTATVAPTVGGATVLLGGRF